MPARLCNTQTGRPFPPGLGERGTGMEGPMRRELPRVRGTTRELEQRARELRGAMTPAERALWQALRGPEFRHNRFRRQHPVGGFILDFYCPAARLVVEVDGGIHHTDEQRERDALRTDELAQYGYLVLRFENEAVL